MSKDDSSGGFLLGFVLGALSGAAVALLYAPKSGDEMREELKEKSYELKDRAQEMGVDVERLEELKERGQTALQQQRARLQEAVEEGRVAAERRKEELLAQFDLDAGAHEQSIDLTDINNKPPAEG